MTENSGQRPPNNDGNNDGNNGGNNAGNAGNEVTLSQATIDAIASASSRQAAQNVRDGANGNNAGNGAGGNDQQQQNNGGNSGGSAGGSNDLLAAIQALPEQITRSVQEAIGTPQAPPNNGANGNNGGNGTGGNGGSGDGGNGGTGGGSQQEPGKSKSFAHWWFGVK